MDIKEKVQPWSIQVIRVVLKYLVIKLLDIIDLHINYLQTMEYYLTMNHRGEVLIL
jgi:hypothetical protein